jgi:hypothetical protein
MVQAALDEAIQQDALGKRAGQGFKAEAWLLITAAAQDAIPANTGWKLSVAQTEGKLDLVFTYLHLFPLNVY